MSTPIEVYDPETQDSVFVDEYGLCSISIRSHRAGLRESFAELTIEGVIALQLELARALDEMMRKRNRKKGCGCGE